MPEKCLKPVILLVPDKTHFCIIPGLLGGVCNTKPHHAMLEVAGVATLVFVFQIRMMLLRYLSP